MPESITYYKRLTDQKPRMYCNHFQNYRHIMPVDRSRAYIMPEIMCGSDYMGGIVHYSNYRYMIENHSSDIIELYGDYGMYGIAINIDIAIEHDEIREILNRLESYLVIDDQLMSEIEDTWKREAIPDIAADLVRELNLQSDFKDVEKTVSEIDRSNQLNWSIEYRSAYLDYKELIPHIQGRIL